MENNIMAKNGDFVTAEVDLPEEMDAVRQGILDGKWLYGESGNIYKVKKVIAVVEKLWGLTLEFYNKWHIDHMKVEKK